MRWLGRHRVTVLVVAAAVVAVAVSAWLGRHDRSYAGALDPRNPDGGGAQAVARVLDREGVAVEVVRSADAFDRATADASTTIVVTSSGNLGRSTTARLLQHQGEADLVVVAPGPQLVRELGVASFPATTDPDGPVAAGCPAYDGLAVRVDTAEAYPAPTAASAAEAASWSPSPGPGSRCSGRRRVLSNDQILERDNAAVALRLLGQRDRLVWYVPRSPTWPATTASSVDSLLPDVDRGRDCGCCSRSAWRGRVARATPGAAVDRAAPGLGQGDRDDAQPGPALPTRRRPASCRGVAALRGPGRARRTPAARRARSMPTAGAGRGARTGRRRRDRGPDRTPRAPTRATDRELVSLAEQLAELDREVRRPMTAPHRCCE